MFKKVENEASLVRDMQNNALLNIDNDGLQAYRKRKNANLQLKSDVDELKEEMKTIKNLLLEMLNK